MNPVLFQAILYGVVVAGTILLVAAFQKGFFFKYFKVRTSFGKYLMVKVRSTIRDYYEVGWVVDGFLVIKRKGADGKKNFIRYSIQKYYESLEKGGKGRLDPFYRCMGVTWVDVDDEKNAICMSDYSVVTGHDAAKEDNLLVRALMRPQIMSKAEIIIIILCCVAVLLAGIAAYFAYKDVKIDTQTLETVLQIKEMLAGKGTVMPAQGV